MRLINTSTLKIESKTGKNIPKYAILSHTWLEGQEVSYQEFVNGSSPKSGFQKILDCCRLARSHGLDWVWIDCCCIDKTSSEELSQSINKMFDYYHYSTLCLVFLSDLSPALPPPSLLQDPSHPSPPSSPSPPHPASLPLLPLSSCRWFKRGWTLQELLASPVCIFYDGALNPIGTKDSLAADLSSITAIRKEYLLSPLGFLRASVAERMSWMADRETSREEDMAYCLLGVFRVSMPLVYGEGREAFLRLQREILAQQDDDSIFAWSGDLGDEDFEAERGVLAREPREFRGCGDIRLMGEGEEVFLDRRSLLVIDKKAVRVPYSATSWVGCSKEMAGYVIGFSVANDRAIGLKCVSATTGKRVAIHLSGEDWSDGLWHRKDHSTRLYCESRFGNLIASLSLMWGETIQVSQDGPAANFRSHLLRSKPPGRVPMVTLIKLFMACLGLSVTLVLLFAVHTYPMLLWGVSMLGWVISRGSKLYLTLYLVGAILVQCLEYFTKYGQPPIGCGCGNDA